jgi:hypothetical protein
LALDAEEANERIASLQKMINSLQHKDTKEENGMKVILYCSWIALLYQELND